jgi:hypothetical protein
MEPLIIRRSKRKPGFVRSEIIRKTVNHTFCKLLQRWQIYPNIALLSESFIRYPQNVNRPE